jgi:hypothetical protein
MYRTENHLLYVLSEPPRSFARTKSHRWNAGDLLAAPKHPALPASDRFLVLHVNEHGRVLALKMSEMPENMDIPEEYVFLGPGGLNLSEADFTHGIVPHCNSLNICAVSYYIRLDKIYFEPMVTGVTHGINDVTVIGHFSPVSMSKIIQQVLSQKSLFASGSTLKQAQRSISERFSSTTDNTLTNPEHVPEIYDVTTFENFVANSYHLEQFLDIAHMAFDEIDYAVIREFLKLPKKTLAEPNVLNCDCNEHIKKAAQSDNEETRTFWRTLDKMRRCAKKLKLKRDPSEILSMLNETSRALGCQRIPPLEFKLKSYSW